MTRSPGDWFVDALGRRPTGRFGRPFKDGRLHAPFFDGVLDALGDVSSQRLVELGCGGGVLIERVLERGASFVIGVDHSPAMLEMARERNAAAMVARRLRLELGDVTVLSVEDATVDAVYHSNVFLYLEDPQGVLGEVARVLRPGGRHVMATVAGPLPRPTRSTFLLAGPLGRAMHAYPDDVVVAMLEGAGFEDVEVTSPGVCDGARIQVATARTPAR